MIGVAQAIVEGRLDLEELIQLDNKAMLRAPRRNTRSRTLDGRVCVASWFGKNQCISG